VSDPEDILERLLLMRRLDERCVELFESREIRGTVHHSSIGQEGAALGVALHKQPGDLMFSTHRGLALCLAWGADPVRLLAEVLGRRGGYAEGLGGHMHIVDPEQGIAGTNGIVGGGLPMAVGAGYALAAAGQGGCVVSFLGDGALNTGAAAEAFNLAAVWQTPVLFVCENNGFAEMSYSHHLTAGTAVTRAESYGMAARSVSGDDVLDVAEATASLIEEVRAGRPAMLEIVAFRAHGHWIGDPQEYRTEEELAFESHDPLGRFIALGRVDPDRVAALDSEVSGRVAALFDQVLAFPEPTAAQMMGPVLST
jgi:TPP-dependent pyruvate/acetoin dehydrogenase alpha subunit